ncbi:hypothetical protein FH972_008924 [Carpinus fangiana]|uniref:Uncharacterized protein n=1 Tax=Carpinus fangiana TaxID=176857 RepID=A0A5N6R2F8_9ROSI|nr:hypothetical protein FH972_008924 [Carpinus fangiana]
MEISCGTSPRIRSDDLKKDGSEETHSRNFELESADNITGSNSHFRSMNALEILRESVKILRYNSSGFMIITALLICPVTAVLLSNVLVKQSIVKRLTIRLLLVAKSSGLPLRPFVKHSCQHFAEMAVSSTMCFPLYITLSLLSKAAVVYSVDCSYSRKKFDVSKFYVIIAKIWSRLVSTACTVVGFSPDLIVYVAMMMGLVFSVLFANAIIICNIAIVISVLEDVSGPQAMLRSSTLIKGQTQVGLLIFLGSTIGMAFIEGLFEHRVKTLSYGDGSSRIWEGPLLVIMFSFVVLIDSMMSAVFYFSCRSFNMEALGGEGHSILETMAVSAERIGIQ